MKLPWVSRALYDQALAQIAALQVANDKLIDALAASKEVAAAVSEKEKPEEMATRPHRMLGAEIRREANTWARERAGKAGR